MNQPAWTRWNEFNPNALAYNLDALATNHPAIRADVDEAMNGSGLWLRAAEGDLIELAISSDGALSPLLISDRIQQSERSMQTRIHGFSPAAEATFILVTGCDLGYSTLMLNQYLQYAPQKAVLTIEPDIRLFLAMLAARPLDSILKSNRYHWAVGSAWQTQCEELIWRRNLFAASRLDSFPSLTASVSGRAGVFASVQQFIMGAMKAAKERFQRMLSEAQAHYAAKAPDRIERILAPSTARDASKAIPYIQQRVLDQCRALGIDVIYHEPGFRHDVAYIKRIIEERPDALFAINRSPSDFAPLAMQERFRLPRFIWCIDDPNCFVGDAFTHNDFVFTWDDAYSGDLMRKQAPGVDHFPYVADLDASQAAYDERFAAPVSYIGQVKTLNRNELLLSEDEAALAECAGREKALNPERSYQSLLLEHQQRFNLTIIESEADEAPRFLRYGMYIVANARRRIAVLERALPFGLKLYGNEDWRRYLADSPLKDCYCGPVDPETEVPRIFRSSTINLNIHSLQALTSLNQRDFNCPLAGGFLLTDRVEGAERFFIPDQELVFYRGLDDLEAKIKHFLEHDDERIAIIERGRRRVLSEHTYESRVPKIIDLFKQRIRERYG